MENKKTVISLMRLEHNIYEQGMEFHSRNLIVWLVLAMLNFLVIVGLRLESLNIFGWVGIVVLVVLMFVEFLQYLKFKKKRDNLNTFYLSYGVNKK